MGLTYAGHEGSRSEGPSGELKVDRPTPARDEDLPSDCGDDNALEDVQGEDTIDGGPDGDGITKEGCVIYICLMLLGGTQGSRSRGTYRVERRRHRIASTPKEGQCHWGEINFSLSRNV